MQLLPQIVVRLEQAPDVKALDHGSVFQICHFFPGQTLQFYISVVLICLLNFFSRHRSFVGGLLFVAVSIGRQSFQGMKL